MSSHESPNGPLDPFEFWRQLYETNERAWNTHMVDACPNRSSSP